MVQNPEEKILNSEYLLNLELKMYVDLALHDDAEIIGRICNDKKCAEI